jgi:hypothetical protein
MAYMAAACVIGDEIAKCSFFHQDSRLGDNDAKAVRKRRLYPLWPAGHRSALRRDLSYSRSPARSGP